MCTTYMPFQYTCVRYFRGTYFARAESIRYYYRVGVIDKEFGLVVQQSKAVCNGAAQCFTGVRVHGSP